jgi:hypothetical protein
VASAPRLACLFFKMNPSKYRVQYNQDGKVDDKQYRVCAGPGFRTISLLKCVLKNTPMSKISLLNTTLGSI